MKRILIAMMILVPALMCGQTRMTGLGDFKIGETQSDIIRRIALKHDLPVENSPNMLDIDEREDAFSVGTSRILKLTKTKELNRFGHEIDPNDKYIDLSDVDVYYLNFYRVSSVPLTVLYLSFYKDTLYRIDCYLSTELSNAMTLKYGDPKIETKEKLVSCRTGAGITYSEKETTYFQEWQINNKLLECSAFTSVWFDSKCKKNVMSQFYVFSKTKESVVKKMTTLNDDIKKKKLLEDKKKKLEGF